MSENVIRKNSIRSISLLNSCCCCRKQLLVIFNLFCLLILLAPCMKHFQSVQPIFPFSFLERSNKNASAFRLMNSMDRLVYGSNLRFSYALIAIRADFFMELHSSYSYKKHITLSFWRKCKSSAENVFILLSAFSDSLTIKIDFVFFSIKEFQTEVSHEKRS